MQFRLQTVDEGVLDSERGRVLALLQRIVPHADITEVGSTAVPGLIGKGDLDVLVRVPPEHFAQTRAALDAVLQRNEQQLSNDVYQGYLVASPLDVAVQLTVTGGPHDTFHRFLHALRNSAGVAAEYNALKRAFDGHPMDEYRAAKSAFIERVLAGNEG